MRSSSKIFYDVGMKTHRSLVLTIVLLFLSVWINASYLFIIYENEPIEKNTMQPKHKPFSKTFFQWRDLITSVLQGLVIAIASLAVYRYVHLN